MKQMAREDVEFIIVHCSATPAHMDIGVAEIDRWHRAQGWYNGCGYHYVIRRDGTVETGPRLENGIYHPGAHCKGYNSRSIGICLVGGVKRKDRSKTNGWEDARPQNNFTESQMLALRYLIEELKVDFPQAQVRGHREFNPNKQCPCFDVEKFLGEEYPI